MLIDNNSGRLNVLKLKEKWSDFYLLALQNLHLHINHPSKQNNTCFKADNTTKALEKIN